LFHASTGSAVIQLFIDTAATVVDTGPIALNSNVKDIKHIVGTEALAVSDGGNLYYMKSTAATVICHLGC
jgi:hypothetical protein